MKVSTTAAPSTPESAPILLRGDLAEAFALAHKLDYDGVEIHVLRPGDIDRTSVTKMSSDLGLGIPTLGTGMAAGLEGLTFSDPDPGVRRAAVERIREHIDLAVAINSGVTVGLIRGRIGNDESQKGHRWDALLECLHQVCMEAKERGVTIFLEPLNRYECDNINTVEEGLHTISELGMGNLKLLLDTFHMNIEEVDIHKSILLAGEHLGHVHLVDTNRRVIGYGHLDLGSVLQALREIGYEGYLSYEVVPLPNPMQAMEDGIKTIRAVLPR